MKTTKFAQKLTIVALLGFSLTGCAAGAIFAGVEAAKTIAQERSAGSRVDDNGIALRVNDAFIQKNVDDLYAGVATTILEGRVMLTGTVADPQLRTDAEDMVWQIPGVKEVINEVQVTDTNSFQDYSNDVWVANNVRGKLLFTKGIASSNYFVETVNGKVYMMGIAKDENELRNAIEVARRVSGVQEVISHVIMKDDPRRAEWATASNYHF